MHCTTAMPAAIAGLDFRPVLPVCDAPPVVLDHAAVERQVRLYCGQIGCDDSNTTAAVAWAHRNGFNTMHAIRIGRTRAAKLRERQL